MKLSNVIISYSVLHGCPILSFPRNSESMTFIIKYIELNSCVHVNDNSDERIC